MKGTNEIVLSHEAVCEMLETHLNESVLQSDQSVKVKKVEQVYHPPHSEGPANARFHVTVEPEEE